MSNIIERAMILTTGDRISALALPEEVAERKDNDEVLMHLLEGKTLKEVERLAIIASLEKNKDKRAAALALGISERTIWNKIREYQLNI